MSRRPLSRSFQRATQLAVFALAVTALAAGRTQQPQTGPGAAPTRTQSQTREHEGYRIGVEVNLVTVPVTVRKREGGFVKELPQSAFRIF